MQLKGLRETDRTPLVGQALAKVSREMDCTVVEAWAMLQALAKVRRENLQKTAATVVEQGVRFDA